jgi:predicted 3-demethylubiquinone-9 3-methyltransferase (glyoxalase superfamily)
MQKITPFLWFDNNAEEAIAFYTSIFKDAKAGNLHRMPDGKIITGTFQLHGQDFMVLNGGPMFKFTPAISFFVNCHTGRSRRTMGKINLPMAVRKKDAAG